MSDQRLFIEVHGAGPDDIPGHEDEPSRRDSAAEIADDVHNLLREEYGLTDISGVATVVNPEVHDQLSEQ